MSYAVYLDLEAEYLRGCTSSYYVCLLQWCKLLNYGFLLALHLLTLQAYAQSSTTKGACTDFVQTCGQIDQA